MKALVLPTFFVIGASKAGTTSLHHYLDAHPQVEMTQPKEPHLFCGPPDHRDRLFVYGQLFAGSAEIRGDASPGYAAYPHDPDVPQRIRASVPDARLVYLVRDPIERAVAHYAEHLIARTDQRPIDVALDPADERSPLIAASRYATQVERYLRYFEPDRLLVIDSDDLRNRRRETLARVFEHVGADPRYWDEATFSAEHYARGADNTRRTPVETGVAGSAAYRRVLRPLLPARLRHALVVRFRRRFGAPVDPQLSAAASARLRAALAPEADRLRELTGQAFAGWSV